jgi:phage protein D/phage baseplate assembly protein gpV
VVVAVDPERKRTLAQFILRVDGANASPDLERAIIKVVVDERLHAPAMVEIHLNVEPHNMRWIDDPTIGEGKELEVFAGYISEESSLCVAKVTSIEVDLDDQMPSMVVRGYDLSFALHRDVKNRSFLDQTDSDIATKIATEAPGLTPKIDTTSNTHRYVLQHAQTNYEFLQERARMNGYESRVVGRELRFRRPEPEGSPVKLAWGSTLKRFSPRLSVAEQVSQVEARGWDDENKEVMVSTADAGKGAPKVGEAREGSAVATEIWGKATRVVSDRPFATLNDGTAYAQAVLDDIAGSFITAAGECKGDPKVRVGATVSIEGVGKRFSGDYYITAARHVITKVHGHVVEFLASTRRTEPIAAQLLAAKERADAPQPIVGIVTNNDDPLQLGRVKVKFPTLFENDESNWARLVSPMAGSSRGFLTIPEIDDEVLVAFENGDQNRPYVLGSVWSSKDMPPEGTKSVLSNGVVNQRLWRSRSGHLFIFDDTDGSESIQIIDKTTNNKIVITSFDNKLDVQLEGDIVVTSRTGKISMTAQKDISIESTGGNVSIKGIETAFEAQSSATMKSGSSMDLKSGTAMNASAGTSVSVTGATSAKLGAPKVDVQGDATTTIKGGIVNIN